MFEDYQQMSAEEKARVKALHKAIRADRDSGERYRNLAWGFIRGFKYRRIERSHRVQPIPSDGYCPEDVCGYVRRGELRFYEHHFPDALFLTKLLAKHLPEFAADIDGWSLKKGSRVTAWLLDPEGAIPVPVRVKKAFVRPEVA